mgnify:FL=1
MRTDDEALRTARVSTCKSRGIVDWLLALIWPLMGVGFLLVLWRLDDIAHGSVEEKFGYVSLVLASFGMCAYYLFSSRVFGYAVLVPEIVWEQTGVRLVADKNFDPLLSFIIFWISFLLAVIGIILIIVDPEDGMDGIPVTYVALALLTAVALISFARCVHYAWVRYRRRRYPGDIALTPQGIRQRVADRVVEVSWQDINVWEGGRRSNMGEYTDLWNAVSRKQVRRFGNRKPKRYLGERPQNFGILLTPVVDNDAMHTFIWTAWTDPAWASTLLSSQDRVGSLTEILSLSRPEESLL